MSESRGRSGNNEIPRAPLAWRALLLYQFQNQGDSMGASDDELREILNRLRELDKADPAPARPGEWLKTLLAPGIVLGLAAASGIGLFWRQSGDIETALAKITTQQSSVIERLSKVETKLDAFAEWVATSRSEHNEFRRKFEDTDFRLRTLDPSRSAPLQRCGETPQPNGDRFN